jgi:hypothetical protein
MATNEFLVAATYNEGGDLKHAYAVLAGAVVCLFSRFGIAGDEADYNQRAAERLVATFHALDRDGMGRNTREEADGNIDMQARFNDIDINRDGIIVASEVERYVRLRYGVSITVGVEAPKTQSDALTPLMRPLQHPINRRGDSNN